MPQNLYPPPLLMSHSHLFKRQSRQAASPYILPYTLVLCQEWWGVLNAVAKFASALASQI